MYNMVKRRTGDLTVSELATIYGCCGLFDMCNDADLMSLSLEGQSKFLDWLSWELTNVCLVKKAFINYVRPEQSQGACTTGYLEDPCADPHGVEWGACEFELRDFARLRRAGPVRDATMNNVKFCEIQPRYRLDGTPITDDREFDMRLATEVILQDLKRMVITGNAATAGQFDGLAQLVASNYTDPTGRRCATMDSVIIDWNGNGLDGGAGITWNGAAIAATWDFVDVLAAVVRRIRQRISWAPALASQTMQVGDMVLVMPTFMTRCLLDMYTCWSVCAGDTNTNLQVVINSYEARTFRNNLLGGMYGDGRIFIDGYEIPLIAYDWELTQGPTTADIYLLTGKIGNMRLINGQLLDMRAVPGGYPEAGYTYTDGGRLLTWTERDHTCVQQIVEMRPRLLSWAPWANARFETVVCNQPGGPMSPDPCEAASYFPETSFTPASCPPA